MCIRKIFCQMHGTHQRIILIISMLPFTSFLNSFEAAKFTEGIKSHRFPILASDLSTQKYILHKIGNNSTCSCFNSKGWTQKLFECMTINWSERDNSVIVTVIHTVFCSIDFHFIFNLVIVHIFFLSLARKQEIIKVTEQLIEAINNGDFEAYT